MRDLDLNADVGESEDPAVDEAVVPQVTSINVACGAHAGDPETMRRVVALAMRSAVTIGAHPGYFDRVHFGRRPMTLTLAAVIDLLLYQVGALDAIARSAGAAVTHVKPHGALYNQAERDPELAHAIVAGVRAYTKPLRLMGRAGSAMALAAGHAGVPFIAEAFADRRYSPDGSLAGRELEGALLTDPDAVAAQVCALVQEGRVTALDGTRITVVFDSLCLHGDTPTAPQIVARVRQQLQSLGVNIRAAVA